MKPIFLAGALVIGLGLVADGHAQTAPARAAADSTGYRAAAATGGETLSVTAGQEVLVRLNQDASSVFVADPEVADVHMPTPRVLVLLGKKAGTTTLFALSSAGAQILKRGVQVGMDLDSLRRMMAARFPGSNLQVNAGPGSLQVSGDVSSPDVADAVVQMITPYLGDKQVLVNRMTISHPLQVQLRVRITEVDRNVTQELGVNWQSLGAPGNWQTGLVNGRGIFSSGSNILGTSPSGISSGSTSSSGSSSSGGSAVNLASNGAFSLLAGFASRSWNLQFLLDALNEEGLLTTLAEPNLVALSGQTASFLAGGEFPIPVAQSLGVVGVEFKQFGVKLDFTPTVLNDHRISLKVRPEVSQIDTSVSVNTNGVLVPGLSVRRADTTVELASGQSFAIAGLLQNNTSNIISQLPGLGSIPVLGKLFSSSNYQNNKTELVIIVTPYLVEPSDPDRLRSPLDSVTQPVSDIEYSFEHAFGSGKNAVAGDTGAPAGLPRLVGQAGYIY
jgi:pilus assembly protein CpaC